MADPATNVEDLEDGEIESDGEESNEIQNDTRKEETTTTVDETSNQDKTDGKNFYYSKSGKKKKSKTNRSEQKVKDKSKKSRKYADPGEDDFVGNIERAIRKAMNKPDANEDRDEENVEERRKHKRRKKYDGKDGPGKKRKKPEYSDEVDESEMMCVRGASPVQRAEAYESDGSGSSRGSRAPAPARRPRPRERKGAERRRGAHPAHPHPAHPAQDPDGLCLYFMQGKCHKGDDCAYSHDAQPPRKMELCKFYLMDCCAKRDKCLYMHADFPCKYYHTGLPCIYKDECKFAHGKPLNESLKSILLKHIESAPKEILGDFPRLNREGALKMIQTTQLKLMQQFSDGTESPARNIPSLFDINIPNPQMNSDQIQSNQFGNERQNKISPKVRQSRWQNDSLNQNVSVSPNSNLSNANVLSIKNLNGVLTPRQISDLTKMGIDNLDQLGQLTVLQLNSIGISLKQITEIQLNTMSIQKLGLINNVDQQAQFVSSNKDLDLRVPPAAPAPADPTPSSELPGRDVDMRFRPNVPVAVSEESNKNFKKEPLGKDTIDIDQYTKDALKFALKDKENVDISNDAADNDRGNPINEIRDVDHRVLAFAEDARGRRRPSADDPLRAEGDTDIRFLQPEAVFKTAAKRNRRSTTDDDEDNNLLIDEKWYSSDEERGARRRSPALSPRKSLTSPPAPHVFEPATVLSKLGDLSKIDISEEVTKLLNTMKNNLHDGRPPGAEPAEPAERLAPRDPRDPRARPPGAPAASRPRSIYECVDGEPTDGRRRADVDLRQPDRRPPAFGDTDLRRGAGADVDLRLALPFKAMSNYTPASEINGSVNSHPPIPYRLIPVHIPRPDYTDVRNSVAEPQALADPRLRKVFRLSVEDSGSDGERPAPAAGGASAGPRVDPRRKPKEGGHSENVQSEQRASALDLQTILQHSNWYKELSSTHKIFVNQHLAPVAQTVKQHQQERQAGKKLDLGFVQSSAVLCNIFTNLGVSLGDTGEFSYLPKPKEALLKTPVSFNQNANPFAAANAAGGHGPMDGGMNAMGMGMGNVGGMNNMNHMHGFGQPVPDPRGGPAPGLLGIAPNVPHNFGGNAFAGPHGFPNAGFNGPQGDFNYMEGDQNFQRFPGRGGPRGRGNDRWNRGGSGRGQRDRKHFNDRGWKNDRH